MTRRTIELIAFFAALLIAAMSFHAWLASHDEQQRLQSTLAAQKQLFDAADARETARTAALNDTLAAINKLKSSTLTPDQVLSALPKYLSLPQPITLANTSARPPAASLIGRGGSQTRPFTPPSSTQQGTAPSENSAPVPSAPSPNSPSAPSALSAFVSPEKLPSAPAAQIPVADLKPLFDFVQDCRSCQAQLAAAKQNSADDAAKIAALTRERDAALTAAKGGTFLRRLRRNALWFAVGAGIGYAAAKR